MQMSILYNSWSPNHKIPFGAIELGEELKINVKAIEDINEIYLIIANDNGIIKEVNMNKCENNIFSIDNIYLDIEDIYFYYFKVIKNVYGNIQTKYYGKSNNSGNCQEYYNEYDINKYQITVSKKVNTPKWFEEGVLYHIFVDRFNKTGKIHNPKKNSFMYANWEDTPMYIKNSEGEIARWDFHGGNLKGIISKLNYLKSLGISIIYLSPIFEAQSNHKYDTGNYKAIDPMFGDEEIFKELIKEAKEKGMSIILDGVFSHTGDDSIYFNKYGNYDSLGAYQSKESKYSSWYNFKNYPNEYDCWWGVKSMPNVNENEESYMDYIIRDKDSVINKWMNYGVKGWRLDVVDELPNKFLDELRKETLKANNESILIGEVWEDASNKISYNERRKYLLGNQLNGVTGYVFKNIILDFLTHKINSSDVYNKFMTIKENYPKYAFKSNLNLLGTHDTPRILTELNEDKELLNLAVAIQMTFEGVPYVYYGDEAGMTGGKDPDNRKTYPWKNEDKELIAFYKKMIKDRNNNEVLSRGDTTFLNLENEDVFAYIRHMENSQENEVLVIVNRSNNENTVSINLKEVYKSIKSAEEEYELIDNKVYIRLEPKSFKILNLSR
ncbi:MAG: alpha-glucosidase C-terminal domain-containing protein [Peptostreptococcaceae bacterium]|nr:alpha-glucosidase C-terminal domain-containing protein [Peptostreptococcaceae bacterium]